jgi:hypothetical protein
LRAAHDGDVERLRDAVLVRPAHVFGRLLRPGHVFGERAAAQVVFVRVPQSGRHRGAATSAEHGERPLATT